MFQYLSMLEGEEEKEFFEKIYYKYREEMFYTAYVILQNKHDAEDIVQDSFLPVLSHLDKMRGNSPEKNWNFIVTIVKNRAINLYNRKKRKQEIEVSEDEWMEMEILDEDLETRVIEKEHICFLMEMLGQMNESYRDILLMRYYHGLKAAEVAEIVETTPDNIRHIAQRAKMKLKSMLEEYGYNTGV